MEIAMRRTMIGAFAAAALALGAMTVTVQNAEAHRGHGIAAGVAAVIIGGILLHSLSRRHHRRYYYYDDYYYPRYRYRPRVYYVPRHYRSHRLIRRYHY
jgi:hypothetical protein